MKEIINNNYEITIERGQINLETTPEDFYLKLLDEVFELKDEIDILTAHENENPFLESDKNKDFAFEIADVILVCTAFAEHYGIDIESVLKEKNLINRKRI